MRGFADTHNHQFAYLGFGGRAFHGRAFGPLDEALPWCDFDASPARLPIHGPGGAGDLVGNIMKGHYGGSILGHRVGGYPRHRVSVRTSTRSSTPPRVTSACGSGRRELVPPAPPWTTCWLPLPSRRNDVMRQHLVDCRVVTAGASGETGETIVALADVTEGFAARSFVVDSQVSREVLATALSAITTGHRVEAVIDDETGSTGRLRALYLTTLAPPLAWRDAGEANAVTHMAGSDSGELFAVTSNGRLWRRPGLPRSVTWTDIGHANSVVGLAVVGLTLFCATSDNVLWSRPSDGGEVNWKRVGHANGVKAMTGILMTLLACVDAGGTVWTRPAIEVEVDWSRAGRMNDVQSIAGIGTSVYVLRSGRQIHKAGATFVDAGPVATAPEGGDVLAVTGTGFFVSTADNRLKVLPGLP